jgi:glycerol-3-phosphate dehydrogenase (NAD(P)+)
MTRLALALGARRETLMGLSGLGDLLLTATSLTSRNTSFGFALARGSSPAELLAAGGKLSEGASTAEAACRLGHSTGVELPIAEAVRAVVAGETGVDAAIDALLSRPLAPTE